MYWSAKITCIDVSKLHVVMCQDYMYLCAENRFIGAPRLYVFDVTKITSIDVPKLRVLVCQYYTFHQNPSICFGGKILPQNNDLYKKGSRCTKAYRPVCGRVESSRGCVEKCPSLIS